MRASIARSGLLWPGRPSASRRSGLSEGGCVPPASSCNPALPPRFHLSPDGLERVAVRSLRRPTQQKIAIMSVIDETDLQMLAPVSSLQVHITGLPKPVKSRPPRPDAVGVEPTVSAVASLS